MGIWGDVCAPGTGHPVMAALAVDSHNGPAKTGGQRYAVGVGWTVTPRLSVVLALARREAELLGHEVTAPEHLLLALTWEGRGGSARVLEELGVSTLVAEGVRRRFLGGAYTPNPDDMAEVLRLAGEESSGLGHEFLGAEHVLLAMTRASAGIPREVFDELGVREQIRTMLQERVAHACT